MRLSSRSVLSIVLSLVTIATILGGIAIAGVWYGKTPAHAASSSTGSPFTRQIASGGTTTFTQASQGHDGVQSPEISNAANNTFGHASSKNNSSTRLTAPSASSAQQTPAGTELVKSFNGINHRDQRLANGGNQFSLEPPDQGLCAGNGFVFETVNDALRIYDSSGKPLTPVIALNAFYHYPPAINRTTGVRGPFVTDPSCYYDHATQRWFHVVLTLDVVPSTGAFTGKNHLDLAVSKTSDPRGQFTIYHIPVQDNGTQGTPNHHCSLGFCLGDYPHIGADANGFYITTNEYSFFGPEFHAAQIYAISKRALASNASPITVTQFDTTGLVNGPSGSGVSGFTVWPATSPDSQFATAQGGTEYFMSSDAATEVGIGSSRDLIVWALTDTRSLNNSSQALVLSNTVRTVNAYSIPPRSQQKKGHIPLGQCLNNPTCSTFLNGTTDPYAPEVEGVLDSNDTRMQQVTYAAGKLWGALDTSLTVGGKNLAGIEWFIVSPSVSSGTVSASVLKQGYLGLAQTNLIYPAIGVTTSGKGVMAFTLVGTNNYPSAAYASIDTNGTGAVHIAAAGLGPQDGFTEYKFYSPFGNGVPRPRWGDYGAAVSVGNTVWIASEYIGQTCTLSQYEAGFNPSQFGSCGGTRTAFANWYTRISHVAIG